MLSFHRVASAPEGFSSLYNRDLSFLLDISINIAEYKLALDIGKISRVNNILKLLHSIDILILLLISKHRKLSPDLVKCGTCHLKIF